MEQQAAAVTPPMPYSGRPMYPDFPLQSMPPMMPQQHQQPFPGPYPMPHNNGFAPSSQPMGFPSMLPLGPRGFSQPPPMMFPFHFPMTGHPFPMLPPHNMMMTPKNIYDNPAIGVDKVLTVGGTSVSSSGTDSTKTVPRKKIAHQFPMQTAEMKKPVTRKRSKYRKQDFVVLDSAEFQCMHCGTTDTPQRRHGPKKQKELCNACGLRYARTKKRFSDSDDDLYGDDSS